MWYKNYFIIELNIILFSWLAQCTPKKKWWGKTKGVGLSKQRSAGEKLRIEIPSHLMRAVGNNAQALITELGIIVRQMASLIFLKWRAIPDDDNIYTLQEIRLLDANKVATNILKVFTKWFSENILVAKMLLL